MSSDAGPYGLETRPPMGAFLNGTLPQSQPTSGTFKTVKAFPNLIFFDPIFLIAEPNTNRLYVLCRQGQIFFFTNNAATTNKTLFLDLTAKTQGWDDCGLLGMAFHPEFRNPTSTNRGYIYVYYNYSATPQVPLSGRLPPTTPSYNRLSRFTVPDGSLIADPNSEVVLINQYDQHLYHNGGGMFFGPDGFLYLTNGDEGDSNDDYDTTQKLNGGLFSGVLRIDVNKDPTKSHPIRRQPLSTGVGTPASSSGNYYIPNDNPWLDAGGSILEEYWAIGLRSPHRMTYDSISGQIWVGDVGEHTVEEVDLIERGGNYQWAYKEGNFAGPKAQPSPLIGTNKPPVHDYIHADNNGCVIGGYVYRGTQFAAQLGGKYIFGDNGSGRIWSLTYNGTNAPTVTQIANMPPGFNYTGLGSFGLDENKEIYMCQVGTNGYIWKLAPQDAAAPEPPALLSQTHAFTNFGSLAVTNGIIPFDVNAPLWSDAAAKKRWIALPNDGAPYGTNEQILFQTNSSWMFPIGTVFVKHFELATNDSNPSLKKRLETRFLVCDTNGGAYGITYKWRADNSDADLLTNSVTENIVITTPTGTRTQSWYYPSRQDCLTCHNSNARYVLGPKTRQLNGNYTYASTGVTDNQLRTWNHLGMFNPPLDENSISNLPAMVNITNAVAPLVDRVRSYIDANCAHCHQPNGVQAYFDARYSTPLTNQSIINGIVNANLGITGAKVVVPTNTPKSIMHLRMNTLGQNQMPPVAKNLIDTQAVTVLDQWINSLPPTPDLPVPWLHQDIGSVGLSGDADFNDGTFTAVSSGADIYGNADSFHYIYRAVTGDVQIIARVKSLQFTDPWTKAGVMVRESLNDYSRHAFMAMTPGNGANFQYRLNNFDSSSSFPGVTNSAPYWVKLVRTGNVFRGYSSPDGTAWSLVGTITNSIPTTAYVGLASCAHNNTLLNTATFDNIDVQVAPPATISLSSISNQSTSEDTPIGPIGFTVSSLSTAPWNLAVTGTSSNQSLVANANIFVEGVSTNRTVTIIPSADQFGQTLITLTGTDGVNNGSTSFLLTVNPVNDPPTLNAINQTTRNTNGSAFNVSLSGIGSGAANESQTLSINASSSATSVCSIVSITYTSPQSSGTLRLRPDMVNSGVATITVTVTDSGTSNNVTSQNFLVYVKPSANTSPTISSISSQSTPEDTAKGPIAFTVSDAETPADLISVAGLSSNPTLVPNENIAFGGSVGNRTITLTPAPGKTGSSTITVSATDTNFGSAITSFSLTVTAANDGPFLSAFTNVTVVKNRSTPLLPFTIGDAELPASQLTVSGSSTNQALIPNTNIVFYGSGTNRALVLTPLNNQIGSSKISVVVSDGTATATNSFLVDVTAGATNFAPVISPITNQVTDEGVFFSLQVVATDPDVLTYSLTNEPAGMTIDANGLIGWTPTEAQGPSTNNVSVIVTDDGEPSLSATQAFSIVTLEVNSPPLLQTNRDKFVLSSGILSVTNVATDPDIPANILKFSLGGGAPAGMLINSNSGVLTWTPTNAVVPSTNLVNVIVKDNGSPILSNTQSFRVIVLASNLPPTDLPPPWVDGDIGDVALPGDAVFDNGSFIVDGSGADIYGNFDAFHFVYQPMTNNGQIIARVVSVQGTDPWAKAGVMIRGSTNDFSSHVFMAITWDNGVNYQFRQNDYDGSDNIPGPPDGAPRWVKLVRNGTDFQGYTSTNGVNWVLVGTVSNNLPPVTLIGLAVTAHDNSALNSSVFDNVTTSVVAPNTPPILTAISNRTVFELSALTITNTATDVDIPTNTLTFSLGSAPSGMTINTNTGVLNWAPTEAQGPSTNAVSVIVRDNGSPILSATQSFTVIVLETNQAPLLTAITNRTIFELSTLTITNIASDGDLPANTLTFSLNVAPAGMTINTNSGVLTWTPTEAQGPSTNAVSVIVRDNGSPILSATQSFTVIVLETNQAPILTAITNRTVFELTTLTITNSASDGDLPANTLTFSLTVSPTGMTINTNTGVIDWTPTEAQGPSTNAVTVVVRDNATPILSATQSFTIFVLETNQPPTLAAITNRTIFELSTLTITNIASDGDIPTNTLAFSLDAAPSGMTLNTNTGVLTWMPTEAQGPSTNSVTVVVHDNGIPSMSATQSFTVTVLETNQAPALTAITNRTIFELSTLTLTNLASDADVPANTLTFSVDTNTAPAGLTIVTNTGVLTWTPTEAQGPSTNTIAVIVRDNGSPILSATQSFTIFVLETNQPPALAAITNRTLFELSSLNISPIASDGDIPTNTLTFSLDVAPAGMTVNTNTGAIDWTPTEAQGPSTNAVTLVVRDNGSPTMSATQSFTVTVLETNQAPILAPRTNRTIFELTTLTITNSASDGDLPANTLTFSLTVSPSGMTINTNTGVIDWTPTEAQGPSTNTVTVAVYDNGTPSLSATQSFTVTVLETNQAPMLAPRTNRTIFELSTLTITNAASDGDIPTNTLTFSLNIAPSGMTINTNSGVLTWTPTEAQGPSTNAVSVVVQDNGTPSMSATQSFTVTVLETNQAPVLTAITNQTIFELTTLTLTNSASDNDLPTNGLSFSLDVAPSGMTIDTNTGVINWTPLESQGLSTNAVTVVVRDDGVPSMSATQSFNVVVLETNQFPTLGAIADRTLFELTTLTITNLAFDADVPANTLTFSLETAPSGMTIDMNSGVLIWTPNEAQGPSSNFVKVVVRDNGIPSLCATQTFSVIVLETNQPPSLEAITNRTVVELSTLSVTNAPSDGDIPANALTFSLDAGPVGMMIDTNTGVIAWTPLESQGPSTNSVTVVVHDSGIPSLTATQSFTVVVLETNQAPVLAPIADQTIFELTSLTLTNQAQDDDLPANSLTFSFDTNTAPAGLDINPVSGVMSWTPTEAQGPSSNRVTVIVRDGGSPSLSATQSFSIIVLESNQPPTLASIPDRIVYAGALLTFTNAATDSDLPANLLSFSLDAGTELGADLASSGVFTWLPPSNLANTTNLFTIRVNDDGLPSLSASQSFHVVVVSRPVIEKITLNGSLVTLEWTAIAGQSYVVEWSDGAHPTTWTPLPGVVTATNAVAAQLDAITETEQRFYRVRLVP